MIRRGFFGVCFSLAAAAAFGRGGRKSRIVKVGQVLSDGTVTGWHFDGRDMVTPPGGWRADECCAGYSVAELRRIAKGLEVSRAC